MLNDKTYFAKIKTLALRAAVSAFLFAALSAAAPVRAEEYPSQDGAAFSDLQGGSRAEFPAIPDVKAPSVSTTPQNAGNNEQLHFWEQLKNNVFDNVCKQAQIDLNQGMVIENAVGVGGNFKRYLRQYPDGKIALIDEVGVKLATGGLFGETMQVGAQAFNIGFSGGLEGKSIVVRKLGDKSQCKALPTLIDIRKFKAIVPVTEERIAKMAPGEIWKFPAVLRAGISGGAGMPVQPWLTISFSLAASRETKPSITLYKMSEDALRLRVRLDRATITRAGVSAGTSFSAGLIGLPDAEFFLHDQLEGAVMGQFNQFLGARFGLSGSRVKGKKILLEFILDPKDPEQMADLAQFLKGNLGLIKKLAQLAARFSDFSSSDSENDGEDELNEIQDVAADGLHQDAAYAGSDHYTGSSHSLNLDVPLALDHDSSSGRRYDRYQSLDSDQVVHVRNVFKKNSDSNLNIPILGAVFKHSKDENFYVVNYEGKDGTVSDAAVVYQRYEGYVHHSEKDARKMVDNMNDILKYAGTKGEGANGDFVVDTNALFPRLAPDEDGEGTAGHAKRYGSAMLSFSLVLAKEAVADIITAPAAVIMKAAMNVMEGAEREIVSKVLPLIGADGKYDKDSVKNLLAPYEQTGFDALGIIHDFVRDAAELVTDLAGVAMIGDQNARADRLSKVLAGKGASRLGYDKLMQVLVQLVDVKNIYASLNIKTDKRIKDEENLNNTYTEYNAGLQGGQDLHTATAGDMRDRFADPSTLSD